MNPLYAKYTRLFLVIILFLFLASRSFYDRDSHECSKDIIIRYEAVELIKESDLNFNSVVKLKKLFDDNVTKNSAEFVLGNIAIKNKVIVEQLIANAIKDKAAGASNLYEEIDMQIPLSIKKYREYESRTQKSVAPEVIHITLNREGIPYAKKICNSDNFLDRFLHYLQMH
jgi:hypothetical protein